MKRKKSVYNIKYKSQFYIFMVILLFVLLIARLFYFQVLRHKELKEKSDNQSYTNRTISAKRGTIYDCNGKALALSAEVDTVSVNPKLLYTYKSDEENNKLRENITNAFVEIFGVDYEETFEKLDAKNTIVTIAKKVEKEKIDQLKKWMSDNKVYSGINIDNDTKRYYPYNSLASNLIGFCGDDNTGLEGIEYEWDSVLTGTSGVISSLKDATSSLIPNKNETYIPAENGSNLTLTIDVNIQAVAEKYLKQAVEQYNCKNGGNVIIMNPNNGDILAMATYPDYDLNEPFKLEESEESLSSQEKLTALQLKWRNKAVNDTYEPGSTFKVLMAAIALEENIVDTDTSVFYCPGYEQIYDTKINCSNVEGHQSETLREALMDSCNPSFMQLGKKIGVNTLYKYYRAFGLFDKTNIGLSGEANSNFHKIENVGPVELAVMSFGQRFNITPLQLITSVCSVLNEGQLMQPRIIKSIENTDDNSITTIEETKVRQVVSKTTATKVCEMLGDVVESGTGKTAKVKGYEIGGKTGTSEPLSGQEKTKGYVSSFLAFSPIEDAQIAILCTLYNPKSREYQGGKIVGPTVSKMLTEILPYLGIENSESIENEMNSKIDLPDVTNKTVSEAKNILRNLGLTFSSNCDDTEIVTNQMPNAGTKLISNSLIKLYSERNNARVSTEVPDLTGLNLTAAKAKLKEKRLNVNYTGYGNVVSQSIEPGTSVEEGIIINIELQPQNK